VLCNIPLLRRSDILILLPIDPLNGRSKFFDFNNLKDEVEVQDLFLLFLPNFLMQSPFHHLIISENYNLFNQKAKMAQKCFNDFPDSNDFIIK
jgi:hypothetical protein